jgi:hypothetical protein
MKNQTSDGVSVEQVEELKTAERRDLANKLDAVGWGLFFIWVGVAFLADVAIGVGLLGVGVITLGMQAVRKYFQLDFEEWELFAVELPLVPILLIVAGLVLLVSVAGGKHLMKK